MIALVLGGLSALAAKPLQYDVILLNSKKYDFSPEIEVASPEELDLDEQMDFTLGKDRPRVYANIGNEKSWLSIQKHITGITWMIKDKQISKHGTEIHTSEATSYRGPQSSNKARGMEFLTTPGIQMPAQSIGHADGKTISHRDAYTTRFGFGALQFHYSDVPDTQGSLVLVMSFSPTSVEDTWGRRSGQAATVHNERDTVSINKSILLVCRSGDQLKVRPNLVGFPPPNEMRVYRLWQGAESSKVTPVRLKP